MNDDKFVFDTYALIEIIKGNKNYTRYISVKMVITESILAELCFNILREHGSEKASYYVDKFSPFVMSLDKEVIKKAMLYRLKNLKSNISITDCTAYYLAKDLNIKFLTGDKEFKNKESVEFVR